ncbi:hypothetical protein DWZ36_05555 [Phocaeicola vulgatus]|nr:hypothetical protein DWZ36_05555 [Phocaeicola vulgatus]
MFFHFDISTELSIKLDHFLVIIFTDICPYIKPCEVKFASGFIIKNVIIDNGNTVVLIKGSNQFYYIRAFFYNRNM